MNILLSRSGGLGDCLLTLPLASHVKSHYPGSSLHILGNPAMRGVAKLSGLFDTCRSIDEAMFSRLFSCAAPAEHLRSYFSEYDLVIFLSASKQDTLQNNIIRAGAGECCVLDPCPKSGVQYHIVSQLIGRYNGSEPENTPLTGGYGFQLRDTGTVSRNGLVIHPGSGSIEKNWPAERFLAVAESCGMPVRYVLGPAEVERGMGDIFKTGSYDACCPASIDELHSVIQTAEIVLGNDSGTAHLAAASGIPTVVLFGPTDPTIWRPIGEHVRVLRSHDMTMGGIRVKDVLREIGSIRRS